MEKKTGRQSVTFGLLIVLALSAYLRLSGITWGLAGGYGHDIGFHPDEFISIQGMLPIEPLAGKLRPIDAYFEGTFNYYLWTVPEMFRELCGGARPPAEGEMPAEQFKFILLSGRLMSVTFDLATIIVLFAIISEVTGAAVAAILGALVYGVMPMQVIYSHFMRTYTLSNLLCVLVIWLSLKALKNRRVLFVMTGVASGLAATTRYPAGAVLIVPFMLVLFQGYGTSGSWLRRFRNSLAYLVSGPLWLLAGGFVFGLFVGEPMLLLDYRNVIQSISFEISHYAPAGARNPFELAPIWKYFSVLIPYATYPILWVLLYLATVYVILRPSLWPTVVPLWLFAALYTCSMAKGYLDFYARVTMLLLPVFCIFGGLAFGDIFPKLLKWPVVFYLVIIATLLVIAPSALFDWAYGRAMQRRDARELLRDDMRELIKERRATTIAVSEGGYYFYTVMPAVFPLKSNNVTLQLESSLTKPADFFVMGFERPLGDDWRNSTIRQVESGRTFRLVKGYSHAPGIFGKTFDLSAFPPDMTYPFPEILLFRKVVEP